MQRRDLTAQHARLVEQLAADGALRSPGVAEAFRAVPRALFLPDVPPEQVYEDRAIATHRLPHTDEWISSSSQPSMMAIMLEQLRVQPGMRILEVGAGTGYNAALLAELTGDPDLVWSIDVDPLFCDEARAHLAAAGKPDVHIVCGDGWAGWPAAAPFDRIIVTAAAPDISPAWHGQLRDRGLLVVPWGASDAPQFVLALRKSSRGLVQLSARACFFMPLRGEPATAAPQVPIGANRLRIPWTVSPPADLRADDLAYFLSLFVWPLSVRVVWLTEPATDESRRLALLDSRDHAAGLVEMGDRWVTEGTAEESTLRALEAHTGAWLRCGRPAPEQIQVRAVPHGTPVEVGPGEMLARREWFDYAVSCGTHGGR